LRIGPNHTPEARGLRRKRRTHVGLAFAIAAAALATLATSSGALAIACSSPSLTISAPSTAPAGANISYDLSIDAPNCEIKDATVIFHTPDGNDYTYPSLVTIGPNGTNDFTWNGQPPGGYVVADADRGVNTGFGTPAANKVRAWLEISGTYTATNEPATGATAKDTTVVHPTTDLSIATTAGTTNFYSGANITFTYSEHNDGDVPLTNVSVTDTNCNGGNPMTTPDSGDTSNAGVLDPTETWIFSCTLTGVTSSGTASATASGFDASTGLYVRPCPPGTAQDSVCDADEADSLNYSVINSSTQLTVNADNTSLPVGGGTVNFTYTETNNGNDPLSNVSVTDKNCNGGNPMTTPDSGDTANPGILDPGEAWVFHCSKNNITSNETHTVTATGTDKYGNQVTWANGCPGAVQSVRCNSEEQKVVNITVEQPPAGEGCTPGYWKQKQHFDSWNTYSPNQQFSSVFDNAFPGKTLQQVLAQGGGGLNALGRHTVAALLNADAGLNYPYTTAEVISQFNAAYPGSNASYELLKNQFASANEVDETGGCPLN
jgi:uncharacterized repeat protein (TIGR01451 family)